MDPEILNYKTSFLNPAMKWFAAILFLIVPILLTKAYRNYGGVFKEAMGFLTVSAYIGALSFLFRVAGDVVLSNKWGESIFYLIFVIFNIFVAAKFLKVIQGFKDNA